MSLRNLFLDEEHGRPNTVARKASNEYTYVVTAVLPACEYGIPSAVIPSHMLTSFLDIWVGLMVDIGGRAASQRHDICLWNIMINSPGSREVGVYQYVSGR